MAFSIFQNAKILVSRTVLVCEYFCQPGLLVTTICLSPVNQIFPSHLGRDKSWVLLGLGLSDSLIFYISAVIIHWLITASYTGLASQPSLSSELFSSRWYQHLISYCLSVSQISPDDCSHRESVHQTVPRPGDAGKLPGRLICQLKWKLRGIFTFSRCNVCCKQLLWKGEKCSFCTTSNEYSELWAGNKNSV